MQRSDAFSQDVTRPSQVSLDYRGYSKLRTRTALESYNIICLCLSLMCPGLGLQICRPRHSEAKPARGVGVQLLSVLGDSKDTIRQQCAKFDNAPSPTS